MKKLASLLTINGLVPTYACIVTSLLGFFVLISKMLIIFFLINALGVICGSLATTFAKKNIKTVNAYLFSLNQLFHVFIF